jgi:PKD repeat protein
MTTATRTVTVTALQVVPPTAVATNTSTTCGTTPLTVSFSAAGSTDSDGGTIASHVWSFGDGTPSGTGMTTSHVFRNVGTFNVTVLVIDNSGLYVTSSVITVVTSAPPAPPTAVATTTSTTYGAAPLTVDFSASKSVGKDATIVSYISPALSKQVAIEEPFGDGSTGTGVNVSHVFRNVGTFAVTVLVTDNHGLSATSFAIAVVTTGASNFKPPKAVAKATCATKGIAPLTVDFSASKSAVNLKDSIASYDWTFGDGSTATGVTTSHVFSTVGTFKVTVLVTDNHGLSATSSPINVTALPATTHVSKLELKLSRQRPGLSTTTSTSASVSVKIKNAAGSAVPGATVVGSWSGMTPDTGTIFVTDDRGTAVFTASSSEKRGTVVFTVTNVHLSGNTYDPDGNKKSSVSRTW